MEILNIILDWIPTIIVIMIVVLLSYKFIRHEQVNVKEWLLLAVSEAEKALGSGTGQLKLRQTYQMFVEVFPVFSKLIGFDTFSMWVDDALERMKHLINTNTSINEYIGTENNTEETKEV